jgi:hypothetical protein
MTTSIPTKELLRDIKNAEHHLRNARRIVETEGSISSLYTHLEAAQHSAFDAKEHIVIAYRREMH